MFSRDYPGFQREGQGAPGVAVRVHKASLIYPFKNMGVITNLFKNVIIYKVNVFTN